MKPAHAPAALPALIFLIAIYAGGALLPTAMGHLAVGVALAAALGGGNGLRIAALFCGLLVARLQPAPEIAGLDSSRPVEAIGWIAGEWREEPGGASGLLELDTVRQGPRMWTSPPRVRLTISGHTAPPPPGSHIRARGRLARSPGFANAHPISPGSFSLRVKSARLMLVDRPPSLPMRLLRRLRETVARPLAEAAPRHPGVGYARALLLGDLEDVSASERLAFRRSGLAHLMAVSGMNVALVAGVAAALVSFCRRGMRLGLVAAAVLAHLALVGPVPSLLRATLMTSAALLGLVLERRALALQSLAIAASAMAALEPSLVGDLGFCLSCAATFGLVVVTPAMLASWPSRHHPLVMAFAVSWAAQAATLPWSLAAFAYISPVAPLLNLAAVPLAGLLLVGALGWIALALAVPAARDLAALPLDLLAAPFGWLPAIPAGPWISLPLPPSWWLGLLLGALAVIGVWSPRAARRTLLVSLLVTARPDGRPAESREIEWVIADVGQGDGSLLRQGRTAMLIDGGGGAGKHRGRDFGTQVWLPILAERGISSLDAVVVTHGDSDHCGGLIDVASYVPIREVWATPELRNSGCVGELVALSRATFRGLAAGDRASVGGLGFEILGPRARSAGKDNDRSLVLALAAEGRRILFTGDIERRSELQILGRDARALRCDVLKVAHHGSVTSSCDSFLAASRPRLAVISSGVANSFGHPSPEVVERLRRAGSRILRTDLAGEIIVRWRRGSALELELPGSPRAVSNATSE